MYRQNKGVWYEVSKSMQHVEKSGAENGNISFIFLVVESFFLDSTTDNYLEVEICP